MLATYEDYCLWLNCVSDSKPTLDDFSRFTVSELQSIKSESDRIRRITRERERLNEKAKRMAEHFAKFE